MSLPPLLSQEKKSKVISSKGRFPSEPKPESTIR